MGREDGECCFDNLGIRQGGPRREKQKAAVSYRFLPLSAQMPSECSSEGDSPTTSMLSPLSTLPEFGLTQYCFGAVVLTLNAIG